MKGQLKLPKDAVMNPTSQYADILTQIFRRFQVIRTVAPSEQSDFATLETAAFHLRKIIEGLAFLCVLAEKNGLRSIPKRAEGEWSADKILNRMKKTLESTGVLIFPQPCTHGPPHPQQPRNPDAEIGRRDEAVLTIDEVRQMYRDLHVWLHEWNPLDERHSRDAQKRTNCLLAIRTSLWEFLRTHLIIVNDDVLVATLEGPKFSEVGIGWAVSRARLQ